MENHKKQNNLEDYINSAEFQVSDFEFGDTPPKASLWKEIDEMQFSPFRWRVEGLIPKEGLSIFASISGEGKSIYLMYLAKCISEGQPWFAFKVEQARVLYINLEMSVSEMQRRGRKIGFNPDNQELIIINEDDFNLNEGIGQEDLKYKWLLKFIYEMKIGVVIVDTFRAAAGGLKEDKAEETRSFFKKFQVLKNSGVSLIFAEHLRKPNQIEGRIPKKEMVLGSQDKVANAEVLLMLRKDDATGQHHIYQRKNRLGVEAKPFAVKVADIIDDKGIERMQFEYIGEVEEDVNKKERAKELILGILSSGGTKNRKELNELVKHQVGDKNIRAALKELSESGEVEILKDGKRFCYFMPKDEIEPKNNPPSVVKDELEDFLDTS
ncbi:MAG: AAA family ATPase [Candidatus Paceibacterota bacterium]